MQKGPKLQRARWSVPFRPFTLINLTKKFFWPALPGGGGRPLRPPLESATEQAYWHVPILLFRTIQTTFTCATRVEVGNQDKQTWMLTMSLAFFFKAITCKYHRVAHPRARITTPVDNRNSSPVYISVVNTRGVQSAPVDLKEARDQQSLSLSWIFLRYPEYAEFVMLIKCSHSINVKLVIYSTHCQ